MSSAHKGIKRGLALSTCAVMSASAMAIVTAPAANAAPGDSMSVALVGPSRDGGVLGGQIVLKTKGLSAAEVETAGVIKLKAANLTDAAPAGVEIVGTPDHIADGASNEFGGADGFDEVVVNVRVSTPSAGSTVNFALYADTDVANNSVNADEARVTTSVTTAGAPASADITPGSRNTVETVQSDAYTITLRDAAGRLTQLTTGESVTTAIEAGASLTPSGALAPADFPRGVDTFTATSANDGTYDITATSGGLTPAFVEEATLVVTPAAAALTAAEVDVVTGADDWDGFDGGTFAGGVDVRVDQSSLQFNFKSPTNKNTTVLVTADPNGGVTIGGQDAVKSYQVSLDNDGLGSLTIPLDAASVTDSGSVAIAGNFTTVVDFVRAEATEVKASAPTYISRFDGSVTVPVTVLDQFGDPVTGVQVAVRRVGNGTPDALPGARQTVNENGVATFTLTDTDATAGDVDSVRAFVYADRFAATPIVALSDVPVADIVYTADGLGGNFGVTADTVNVFGSTYKATDVSAEPLTDAVADNDGAPASDEEIQLAITGGTQNVPVTVTADNGALVIRTTESKLTEGSASDTATLDGTGATSLFSIIGTKVGTVNVTVASGGREKTFPVTIKQIAAPASTARILELSGPAKAASGDTVTFEGKVTDAFGNAVGAYVLDDLNVQIFGPGRLQGLDVQTAADGTFGVVVRVDGDADSPVTVQVAVPTGDNGSQFGANAGRETSATNGATTDDAAGLPASVRSVQATISEIVNIEELERALEVAQANLGTAQANLAIAQARVAEERQDVRQARRKLRNADTRREVRIAKRQLRKQRNQLELAITARQAAAAAVAAAQVAVDEAQAALDEARG